MINIRLNLILADHEVRSYHSILGRQKGLFLVPKHLIDIVFAHFFACWLEDAVFKNLLCLVIIFGLEFSRTKRTLHLKLANVLQDVISDLVAWDSIEQAGNAMSPDTGSLVPVYRITGRLPRVDGLVDYKDLF